MREIGISGVSWKPPDEGWIKLNTGGAVERTNQMAAAGGVLRDHLGRWRGGFAMNHGICGVIAAELWAIIKGLELCWDLGFTKVVVETDSLLAAKTI